MSCGNSWEGLLMSGAFVLFAVSIACFIGLFVHWMSKR